MTDEPGAAAEHPHPFVLAIKDISVPGIGDAYNPGLVSDGKGGYLFSFRFDEFTADLLGVFKSFAGVLRLDQNLEVVPDSVTVFKQGSMSRQDARLFNFGGKPRLIYSDIPPFQHFRTLFMATVNDSEGPLTMEYDAPLQARTKRTEKNWAPFVYVDELGVENLLLSYSAQPHKVLKVQDPTTHQFSEFSTCQKSLPWKWGGVRGGTPAQLVDGEYLSFFHSTFVDDVYKHTWYVFGAYTFEAKPPFCMKKISPEPIFFRGLYSANPIQPKYVPGRNAFPVGLELSTYEGREAFLVSYGDSNVTSKILIIDRQKFLESLIEVK